MSVKTENLDGIERKDVAKITMKIFFQAFRVFNTICSQEGGT